MAAGADKGIAGAEVTFGVIGRGGATGGIALGVVGRGGGATAGSIAK